MYDTDDQAFEAAAATIAARNSGLAAPDATEDTAVADTETDDTSTDAETSTEDVDDDTDEDEETEEDSEDDSEDDDVSKPVELSDDSMVTYNGKTFKLKDGVLMRDDYSRKTAKLKTRETEVEAEATQNREAIEYATKAQGYFNQLNQDFAGVTAYQIAGTTNPGNALLAVLANLEKQDVDLNRFYESVSDTDPDDTRAALQRTGQVAQLQAQIQQLQERENARIAAEQQQAQQGQASKAQQDQAQRDYDDLLEAENLTFASDADEDAFQDELIDIATRYGLNSYQSAYALYVDLKAAKPKAPPKPDKTKVKRAINRISSPTSGASGSEQVFYNSDDEAFAAAERLLRSKQT